MLTGRIPGLRVWQKSSEPGTFNNSFDIRGMGSPLIIMMEFLGVRKNSSV